MKKLFFAALIATTFASTAFATDANKINYRVMTAFKSEYRNVGNVEWTLKAFYAKATFQQNGEIIEAFFNLDGERIGSSRHIAIDELPTSAKRQFAKLYAGYDVKEVIKFEGVEENAYFISADNEKRSVILKVDSTESISLFKDERKK